MKDQFPIGLLRVMGYGLILAALTSILFVAPVSSAAQQEPAAASAGRRRLLVTVTDENGVAVPSARVTLVGVETQAAWKGETDYAGRREFNDLPPGLYRVQVEKEGFYAASLSDVRVGNTNSLEITLNHQQEFSEVMDVTYSPPAIDPTKTSASEGLNSQEIINIPYPSSRDVRNLLPFIPGVVQDVGGQIHVNGSSTNQTFTQLDGFNITHPASGLSEMRVSADALRSIEVLGSRYSAEYGKGSGGVLSYATGMGDDRYRFSATNFLPSLQNRKGIAFDNWTPRATFSGPLRRKKAWFFDAADAEYNVDIIEELPDGADRNHIWRIGNLAKAQVNWNPAHIFTAGLLVNRTRSDRAGISRFSPEETTRDLRRTGYLLTLKQQSYLANGMLAEIGLGMNQFRIAERPLGQMPFVLSPDGASGNFFRESESLARRYQVIASLYLPPARWHGRHEFRVGTDLNRVTYDQFSERRSITILRENGTRARRIEFGNNPGFRINNFEAGGFVQDRWALSKRSLLELGLRLDW
ncbi:MAG TPA: carboxypeptidase regulatory-like domain-containing protein, partial [Blastocatellia bacterium]|nr:carboxypeptidase regulatory-like domain-containing protein [Blastocatellia bacterium]